MYFSYEIFKRSHRLCFRIPTGSKSCVWSLSCIIARPCSETIIANLPSIIIAIRSCAEEVESWNMRVSQLLCMKSEEIFPSKDSASEKLVVFVMFFNVFQCSIFPCGLIVKMQFLEQYLGAMTVVKLLYTGSVVLIVSKIVGRTRQHG